jgi:hypothetical protein
MSTNIMRRATYRPYSPDLAPCDFYLFGYVKESLSGKEFAEWEELLAAVTRIVEGLDKVALE